MARRKREPMSEGKKNIIGMLLEEYDIKSAKDIEDALKDLLGGTIQEMLESEMDEHLGYQEYERSDNPDSRNGKKTKKIRGNFGETEIEVPQDRNGSFEPKVVKKRQKDISGIEQKIISLYAKGMTTRQISETIEDIYGFEVSDGMVSDITDRLLPQIEDWQKRPLDEVYPIVFVDAVHFSVRENGQIRKLAAYVILAVSMTGHKEVLSIHIGENESAKYWLGVLNDLKTIYHAPSEDAALEDLDRVAEKWEDDYPNALKSWYKNWDVISPIFKFSSDVRKVIYTTNAIESLNSGYRRLNKQRSVFPSDTALLKALYLATHEIAKKWTMPLRNWGKVLGELEIMYPDRLG